MATAIEIRSTAQFEDILRSSRVVVTDFYAEWCGPCKQIAPIYEELAAHLSLPNLITFTKVNIDAQKQIASKYAITMMPSFMIFKLGEVVQKIRGADTVKLQAVVRDLILETKNVSRATRLGTAAGDGITWRKADLPRGYHDVTSQVDLDGLDLLNADTEYGSVKVLFEDKQPTGHQNPRPSLAVKDWVESDTDEQLMLYIPFRSTLKTHSLQITSLPSTSTDEDLEIHMRPKTIQIYPNRAHILGFEEADQCPATQTITLTEGDWDDLSMATLSLRFVKFQSVTSLNLFIVDGDGNGDRTRIDRLRIIGEVGEKRDPGPLEPVEEGH